MSRKLMMILLVFIMILGGCGRLIGTVDEEDEGLKDDDLGSRQVEIALVANPSTGYAWHYTLEPEGIVQVVDEDFEADSDAEGAGGTHIWRLKAISEGTAEMTFVYYFLDEKDNVSGDPVTYRIEAGPDGKLDVSLVTDSSDADE